MKLLLLLLSLWCTLVWSQTKYITTIYPFKIIISPLLVDSADIAVILPPGASPHTYEMRPSDIKKVSEAIALFQGGQNLDVWAYKFKHPRCIELINFLPPEYLLFFDQGRYSGEDKILDPNNHRHHGVDPHFWSDPLAVKALLPVISDTLCKLDPDYCVIYQKNYASFANALDSLYIQIQVKLAPVRGSAVMLAQPFFRYYLNRFDIKVVDIIEPIPGKEPTPADLKKLIQKATMYQVKAILSHPQLSDRSAQLVSEATGISVIELDPLGGIEGRRTYDELLLYNTRILLEVLQ